MSDLKSLRFFGHEQIDCLARAVLAAEELVSGHYKMSGTEWGELKYDFKTLAELQPSEIVFGPLAQILKYRARPRDAVLETSAYDFYKICIQDHGIIEVLDKVRYFELFPFLLYVAAHELVHVVRFSRFFGGFEASAPERLAEESAVHETSRIILSRTATPGIKQILLFYDSWQFRI